MALCRRPRLRAQCRAAGGRIHPDHRHQPSAAAAGRQGWCGARRLLRLGRALRRLAVRLSERCPPPRRRHHHGHRSQQRPRGDCGPIGKGALELQRRYDSRPAQRRSAAGRQHPGSGIGRRPRPGTESQRRGGVDGALCSAPAAPHSTPLAGVVPWCGARVSARAPAAACAVEARVFVGGAPGCVFARNLALHELHELQEE